MSPASIQPSNNFLASLLHSSASHHSHHIFIYSISRLHLGYFPSDQHSRSHPYPLTPHQHLQFHTHPHPDHHLTTPHTKPVGDVASCDEWVRGSQRLQYSSGGGGGEWMRDDGGGGCGGEAVLQSSLGKAGQGDWEGLG